MKLFLCFFSLLFLALVCISCATSLKAEKIEFESYTKSMKSKTDTVKSDTCQRCIIN